MLRPSTFLAFAVFSVSALAVAQPARRTTLQPDARPDHPDHVELYGTFNLTHVDTVPNGPVSSSITSKGLGLGLNVNVYHHSPLTIGIGFGLAYVPETNNSPTATDAGRADTEMLTTTLGIHLRNTALRPYAQIAMVGNLHATPLYLPSSGAVTGTSWRAFEFVGGADYPLARHFSLRLVEIGIGDGTKLPKPTSVPDTVFFTLNSGVMVHF
jgi:hypothetical protein